MNKYLQAGISKARAVSSIFRTISDFTFSVESNPIFILGNQKAGTSAITALLGKATASSYIIDLRTMRQDETKGLFLQQLELKDFISKNFKFEFSKKIIKEPNLTLCYTQIKELYPSSPKIFIIRDPRQNIRSILNRLKIPGNQSKIEFDKYSNSEIWRNVIYNDWLGITYRNYIESLAKRWNFICRIYFENPNDFILVKYEDFNKEKVSFIKELCENLELNYLKNIDKDVNTRFQPKGKVNVDIIDFFGARNLAIIENTCKEFMQKFDYN